MQQRDQAFLVRVQEAVVPRPPETLGQDVLQEQMQEVGTGQGARLNLAAAPVSVAEADLAVAVQVAGEDVGFPEHPTIEVTAEIDQRLVAVADAFPIDHPLLRQRVGQAQPGGLQGGKQLAAKRLGQRPVDEEIAGLCPPASGFGIQAGAGHDEMHMRVQVEPARVRMQHCNRAGFALQLPVVPAERLHRRPGAGEQGGVDRFGVPEGHGSQFAGQGEGEQEVLGGHPQLALTFEPTLALELLAVRT